MSKSKLIIFDFDGTILHNPDFYKNVYSKSLDDLIGEKAGKEGLEVLEKCRKNFDGKGELALLALNIPFKGWAERLMSVSLDCIKSDNNLVDQIKKIDAIKVIYSGSPAEMVRRVLARLGFSKNDFDLIVAWQEPEFFPVKWTCSPIVFENIIKQFNCAPERCLAVGDDWDTDLMPAKSVNIKTVQVGKNSGKADLHFDTVQEFLKFLME